MRVVISKISNNFEYDKSTTVNNDDAQDMDFQYLIPASHILEYIILSNRKIFTETLLTN